MQTQGPSNALVSAQLFSRMCKIGMGWVGLVWTEKMCYTVFPVVNVAWDITFVLEMLHLIWSGLGVTVVVFSETFGSDELWLGVWQVQDQVTLQQ